VVVVLCPDRLARKYAYQVLLLEEFKRLGVEVHFCERPIGDSPDDQLLLQIQGAVAEYERAKILERSRRGRLHRARMGELGPSRLPYGYRHMPKKHGGDGQIRVNEEEAALVRQVFEWYAQEGMTLYGLLGRVNASRWYTRAGRKEWSATTLLRMLRCEWYLGRAYYNRTRSVRNQSPASPMPGKKPPKTILTVRPRGEWIEVPVPTILDEELFARVLFGRLEPTTGIDPFDRLVSQVMAEEPYRSARRVFWVLDNGSSHRGDASVQRFAASPPQPRARSPAYPCQLAQPSRDLLLYPPAQGPYPARRRLA
jgi:hypothetical protein